MRNLLIQGRENTQDDMGRNEHPPYQGEAQNGSGSISHKRSLQNPTGTSFSFRGYRTLLAVKEKKTLLAQTVVIVSDETSPFHLEPRF
jgi:hypothetical protein